MSGNDAEGGAFAAAMNPAATGGATAAGTDAAAMVCKAKISDDGSHYILNGEKMWVTNGASADIFVLFAKEVVFRRGRVVRSDGRVQHCNA